MPSKLALLGDNNREQDSPLPLFYVIAKRALADSEDEPSRS